MLTYKHLDRIIDLCDRDVARIKTKMSKDITQNNLYSQGQDEVAKDEIAIYERDIAVLLDIKEAINKLLGNVVFTFGVGDGAKPKDEKPEVKDTVELID